jgi:hypothetical protein
VFQHAACLGWSNGGLIILAGKGAHGFERVEPQGGDKFNFLPQIPAKELNFFEAWNGAAPDADKDS